MWPIPWCCRFSIVIIIKYMRLLMVDTWPLSFQSLFCVCVCVFFFRFSVKHTFQRLLYFIGHFAKSTGLIWNHVRAAYEYIKLPLLSILSYWSRFTMHTLALSTQFVRCWLFNVQLQKHTTDSLVGMWLKDNNHLKCILCDECLLRHLLQVHSCTWHRRYGFLLINSPSWNSKIKAEL